MKKFNLPFILLEKRNNMSAHPSAHYINLRTMEVNILNLLLDIF